MQDAPTTARTSQSPSNPLAPFLLTLSGARSPMPSWPRLCAALAIYDLLLLPEFSAAPDAAFWPAVARLCLVTPLGLLLALAPAARRAKPKAALIASLVAIVTLSAGVLGWARPPFLTPALAELALPPLFLCAASPRRNAAAWSVLLSAGVATALLAHARDSYAAPFWLMGGLIAAGLLRPSSGVTAFADPEDRLAAELPHFDPATATASRRLFEEELALAFEGEPGVNVAVLLAEVDQAPAPPHRLAAVAATVQAQLRLDIDLLARHRPGAFAALLPGADLGDTARVAERIRAAVAALGDHQAPLTVSVGFASTPRGLARPERLMRAAEGALLAAQRDGRNRIAPPLARAR